MRNFFFVLIIALNKNCFSQDLRYFNYDKPDWTVWENSRMTINFLTLNMETFKDFPYDISNSIQEHINDFHLVDIDNDNISELIYNGWNGGEGEIVMIYKLINHKYIKQQYFFGKIVDFKKSDSHELRLVVLDYSCCAGYVDHVEIFNYNHASKKFEITIDIAKINITEIPKKLITPIRFEVLNTPYYLRYTPEIVIGLNDKYFEFKPINGQNITATYKTGDRGIAYAESIDSTGRIWWLVVMDKLPSEDKLLFYEGSNGCKSYKPIGWISSKYLKIIN